MKRARSRSSGLTLVEVLLAMAIMAMVTAALTQLQDSGARAALRATLTAEASLICQCELDAWLAGNRSSSAQDAWESVPSSPGWSRRFVLQSPPAGTGQELMLLTVEVLRSGARQPQFSLSRWVASRNQGGKP